MFSTKPTPQEIFMARIFPVPLVPIGADPTPKETASLAAALLAYSRRSSQDDFSSLTSFIDAHPNSPWNAALLTNLGLEYYHTGNYSKTLGAWHRAWELSRVDTDPKGKAVADLAIGELAYMYARLGRMTELEALLKSVEGRAFSGPATERIIGAREGLWNMQNRPEISFCCGPFAIRRIKLALDPTNPGSELSDDWTSTERGTSLLQVEEISQKLGLHFQMAFREQGGSIIVPSVVHLQVDHFAAIIRQEGERYLLQDPTFGSDVWVTRTALEAESSGYFLIPSGELAHGWRTVEAQEGETVWGKGVTTGNDPDHHGPCDPATPGDNSCPQNEDCKGMAVSRVHLMLVSLNINDEPVGYSPPVGPAVRFTVRYNQREANQPPVFNYSSLGPKWTFDWLSYITDDPDPAHPPVDVTYYIMGGGTRTFTGFDNASQTFAFQQLDQTQLTRTSPNSYEMLSRDGAKKIFSLSDGSNSYPRKVFLTQLIDPHGNAVALSYDANLRLVAITDAIGQVTTISYENADLFKITKVTDPFGRYATFDYDEQGRLAKVTDVIGITSQFTYDAGDFIETLTTLIEGLPASQRITRFIKESVPGNTRVLETIYPNGDRDRVEYNQSLGVPDSELQRNVPGMAVTNQYLAYRNTFYWSKKAYAAAYPDYTQAKVYHWLHGQAHNPISNTTSGILESIKDPLESRVWYYYLGQLSRMVGSTNKPAQIGRVLDDGSTQLFTYEYNSFGNVTKKIDPVGRTFSYQYAENGIDLLEVRQTRAEQNQLLSQITYNAQHLPLTSTDAAGQTTSYTYNARGQVLTATNAKNETTTYVYDANGYLSSVHGPLAGASMIFTYDSMGRVRTKTDESGYTLTFDYDDLDRLTKITFPDGTFDEFTFTLLDQTAMRDRAGRQTTFEYNSIHQMTKRTDPLNQTTLFQWCKCGALKSITDPLGRTTTWRHDLQGRLQHKQYADGSTVTYRYENTTSRLRQRIDERLQVTQYDYNVDDTIRRITYNNAVVATPSVAFTYDPDYNRITSMADGTGTTRYSYIPINISPTLGAGQLASVDGPLPHDAITFGYDELGRRVLTAIDGVASTDIFDAAGRLISTSNALGVFNTLYDGNSFRKASQSFPNGQTTEFVYMGNLGDQQLQRITNKVGNTPISEFIYDRATPTGQITFWSQQAGAQMPSVYNFTYDAVDQLTAASILDGDGGRRNFGYSYDPTGNRLTEQADATTRQFAYNALNQLTSVDGDAGPDTTYQWDAEQRLVSITSGDQTTEFIYDGLGRRVGIRHSVNGGEVSNRRFVWCDNEICEERTPEGTVVKRFFPQGMKLENGAAAGAYFYSWDHLGSIRELTDSAGTIRARYSYDPFGRPTRLSGDLDADFGFAGMFWSPETGLNLTWFRVYDPNIGRWLSRDLLKDAEFEQGINLFVYVHSNPVSLIDRFGLCCEPEEIDVRYARDELEQFRLIMYLAIATAAAGAGFALYYSGGAAATPAAITAARSAAIFGLDAALATLYINLISKENALAKAEAKLRVCRAKGCAPCK